MSEARTTIREKLIRDGLLCFVPEDGNWSLLTYYEINAMLKEWAKSQPEDDLAELAKRVDKLENQVFLLGGTSDFA